MADLGIESVRKESFLLHYINSSLEEIIRIHVWLLQSTESYQVDVTDWKSAQEQERRDSFREKIRDFISKEITGIYSRIVPAMFEHRKLNYLDETLEQQSLFAFWCMDAGEAKVAIAALERIFKACVQLLEDKNVTDVYRSARRSIHLAEIGIYALAKNIEDIAKLAMQRYRDLRARFKQRYPDLRFSGDFESAERDLIKGT